MRRRQTVSKLPICPAFEERKRRCPRSRDLSGLRCSRLLVLTYAGYRKKVQSPLWLCQCDCGERTVVRASHLIYRKVQSCGCAIAEINVKHGLSKSPAYVSWQCMKVRCYNPKAINYKNYGGRGIKVCKRWLDSFENFLADMGERPRRKSLDRKDVNGNYTPKNCRWATKHMQDKNRRNSKANKPAASPQADVANFTDVEEPF